MWLTTLSGQLPVVALVGRYPTNQLIGRGPLPERHDSLSTAAPFLTHPKEQVRPSGISRRFQRLSPSLGQVTHVLLTRSPLARHSPEGP